MATKKSQTAKKVAPKATKTVTTSTGKTKTVPAKKPATKPTPKTTSTTQPPKKTGCVIACIIGALAAIALLAIGIVALVNNINHKADSSLVVMDGDGEKVTTKYVSYLDDTFRLKIPDSLKTVDEKDLGDSEAAKSIIAAYANDDETVSLGIATNKDAKLTNDQVKTYAESMKSTFEATGTVSNVDYYTKGGHNIATMRISLTAGGNTVVEDLIVFSLNDQLVMITITYSDKEEKKWQPVNDFIINSLDFKK